MFERTFDVAVFGAGLIGVAAIRQLVAEGKQVAWIEPSGDLLWEVSRTLENHVGPAMDRRPGETDPWEKWLKALEAYDGVENGFIDPATAEIFAAREALAQGEGPASLLTPLWHATPVAAKQVGKEIAAVQVATKAGLQWIRAHQWVDTTEEGLLARLCDPAALPRLPSQRFRSLVLQSTQWPDIEPRLEKFLRRHPGSQWLISARKSERRLRIPTIPNASANPANGLPWNRQALQLIRELRDALPGKAFLVSHFSHREFPVYQRAPDKAAAVSLTTGGSAIPTNLLTLSPSWTSNALESLADRFHHGAQAAERLAKASRFQETGQHPCPCPGLPGAAPAPHEEISCDVVVAGTGTAGAIAAIASARAGASTLALELAPFPGGIGTGGGITEYFHGASGGLQEELDALTAGISALMGTAPGAKGWHHDAKKWAIWSLFEEARVDFRCPMLLYGAERDAAGQVTALLAVQESKRVRIRARAFIDSTGDGDLCALAGADFTMGRPGDGRTLSCSQVAFFLKEQEGRYRVGIINYDSGWVDATDPADLTRARLKGIAQHWYADWPREDRPFLLAPLLGVRQSRHIRTDAQVTLDDLICQAQFEDAVGEADALADTHSVDFEFESDEMFFYLWVCRSFSNPLKTELPYRMLLPRGLDNVWVACRAAGIEADAAYCVRMQRDMQRLGEAAGIAAALSVRQMNGPVRSREPDWDGLRGRLQKSGARKSPRLATPAPGQEALLASLDTGQSGLHLWWLAHRSGSAEEVAKRLASPLPGVSFYAAAVLAFGGDPAAEERLLHAVRNHETGISSIATGNRGAYGQAIDIPFWLQAIVLLRLCGTARCLDDLGKIAASPQPFNVLTITGLTLERLAGRLGPLPKLINALDCLLERARQTDSHLPTSRSLWETLKEEPQSVAPSWGADTREDHSWQLHLIVARAQKILGREIPEAARRYASDPRSFVRKAFLSLRDY